MNGFLNILKPAGISSAAVVGKIRRITGEKRVGRGGAARHVGESHAAF